MITMKVTFDTRQVKRYLSDLERNQLPFATAAALTRTAKRVQNELLEEMKREFDRPTPWTLRSTFIAPATKRKLEATVGLKDRPYPGNRLSSAQILAHQFAGGGRHVKGVEMWLRRAGYLGANEFVTPGQGARLDRYGNMSRGQVQQILSQLKAGLDPAAHASQSTRSKRNVRRAGAIFWSRGEGRTAHLPRGAWQRHGLHLVKPLLIAVASPSYTRRINLRAIGEKVVREHAQREFNEALATALRTAR